MNKLTKLIIIATAVCSLSSQALAHGGEGRGGRGYEHGGGYGRDGLFAGLALGAIAGAFVGSQYQPVYQQPYYQPPQTYYVPAPVQQCTNVVNQVFVNGYVQNIYSVACYQNGQWVIVR